VVETVIFINPDFQNTMHREKSLPQGEKYQKYQMDYKPMAHEYRADDEEKEK
jgi:cell filamentation protein